MTRYLYWQGCVQVCPGFCFLYFYFLLCPFTSFLHKCWGLVDRECVADLGPIWSLLHLCTTSDQCGIFEMFTKPAMFLSLFVTLLNPWLVLVFCLPHAECWLQTAKLMGFFSPLSHLRQISFPNHWVPVTVVAKLVFTVWFTLFKWQFCSIL